MLNMLKNSCEKGSALVFAMILIANAMIVVSSIVFLATIQNRSSSVLSLTPVAFQQADSGVEHVLKEISDAASFTAKINDLNLCTGNGGGYDVNSSSGKCAINNPKVDVYFLDSDDIVLISSGFTIDEVGSLKVIGEAKKGSNRVSRALQVSLFSTP
jgi:hypothetical protein